jgi:hypothetical protein
LHYEQDENDTKFDYWINKLTPHVAKFARRYKIGGQAVDFLENNPQVGRFAKGAAKKLYDEFSPQLFDRAKNMFGDKDGGGGSGFGGFSSFFK